MRLDNFFHLDGRKSNGMIKVKPMHFDGLFMIDDEFLVVNILSSVDGLAILQCETETGGKFSVNCHGTHEYRRHILINKNDFIGKHVRVEFSGWTKAKKPFHPVSKCWREKYDE